MNIYLPNNILFILSSSLHLGGSAHTMPWQQLGSRSWLTKSTATPNTRGDGWQTPLLGSRANVIEDDNVECRIEGERTMWAVLIVASTIGRITGTKTANPSKVFLDTDSR